MFARDLEDRFFSLILTSVSVLCFKIKIFFCRVQRCLSLSFDCKLPDCKLPVAIMAKCFIERFL